MGMHTDKHSNMFVKYRIYYEYSSIYQMTGLLHICILHAMRGNSQMVTTLY